MFGYMPGKRRQGGQKKTWIDDVTEWTKLGLPELVRLADDRVLFRKLVISSSTIPARGVTVNDDDGCKLREEAASPGQRVPDVKVKSRVGTA
jgi:hypothetical protein